MPSKPDLPTPPRVRVWRRPYVRRLELKRCPPEKHPVCLRPRCTLFDSVDRGRKQIEKEEGRFFSHTHFFLVKRCER